MIGLKKKFRLLLQYFPAASETIAVCPCHYSGFILPSNDGPTRTKRRFVSDEFTAPTKSTETASAGTSNIWTDECSTITSRSN
jgi:hypothetical protein